VHEQEPRVLADLIDAAIRSAMHAEHLRKLIVERRLLDTAALQGVDHRSHFGLHQDQVAH